MAGVFLAIFVGLVILYLVATRSSGPSGQPVANIRCDTGEHTAVHLHSHLQILYKGNPASAPANIGSTATCLYWLHTHDDSGIIHVEAPKEEAKREFTLGDFFTVWHQPLSRQQVATFEVAPGEQMKVWVDGQAYTGDPAKIPLKSHAKIVIEIGPPFTEPPPDYTWDMSQYPS